MTHAEPFATDQERISAETAIAATFARLSQAWNRGDGPAYGRCFTENADYVDVTGAHTRGAEAIGQLHQFLFDGPLRGSTLDSSGTPKIRFLSPAIAVAIGRGGALPAGGDAPADDRASINTTVLVKHIDEWRITAFQNNRVQPAGTPPSTR